MEDAMTQLAKEYLQTGGYLVDTNIKIGKISKKGKTESDVDIIAVTNKPWKDKNRKNLKRLEEIVKNKPSQLICEVKTYAVDYDSVRSIFNNKFNDWDEKNYVKKYTELSGRIWVLFCYDASDSSRKFAEGKNIKIITASDMIDDLITYIIKKTDKKSTYYKDRPIYSTLRMLIYLLNYPTSKDNTRNIKLECLIQRLVEKKNGGNYQHPRDLKTFLKLNKNLIKELAKEAERRVR